MGRRRKTAQIKVKEDLTANVIPMVDIMFLLVLFFMLAADMSQKELEVVELPTAVAAINEKDEVKTDRMDKRPTVNVFHDAGEGLVCPNYGPNLTCRVENHWKYVVKGNRYDDTKEGKKALEAKLKEIRMEYDEENGRKNDPVTATKPSEMAVMVRADRAAPFGYIQIIMAICGRLSIYKVQVGAELLAE